MYQLVNVRMETFRIIAPKFLFDDLERNNKSLCAIAQYEDKGGRLESAARRAFFIRCSSTLPIINWTSLHLPTLDKEGIVFPEILPKKCFLFPKICKDNEWSESEVNNTMTIFHQNTISLFKFKSEFSKFALPSICKNMLIGQYYQGLPRSGSADAIMRLNDNTVLEIQYKNYKEPIKRSEIIKHELDKSSINDFNCYLVVICISGHDESEDIDLVFSPENSDSFIRKVVVLSRKSVLYYLGQGCYI